MNALPPKTVRWALTVTVGAAMSPSLRADDVKWGPDSTLAVPRPPWVEPVPPPAPLPLTQPVLPAVVPQRNPAGEPSVPAPISVPPSPDKPAPITPAPPPPPPSPPPAPSPVSVTPRVMPTPERGPYVSLAAGLVKWKIEGGSGIAVDASSNVAKVAVGHRYGLWRGVHWGTEVGWVDLGQASQDSDITGVIRFKASGLYGEGAISYPLAPQWWIQGQLGVFYARSTTQPGGAQAAVGPKWGLGAAFELTPRWALRLDWESYPVKAQEKDDTSSSALSVLSFGVRYRF